MFSISQPDFLHLCAWTKVILLKKPSGELLGVGWAQRTFIVIRFSATSQLILQIPHKLIQIVVYVCIYIYISISIFTNIARWFEIKSSFIETAKYSDWWLIANYAVTHID